MRFRVCGALRAHPRKGSGELLCVFLREFCFPPSPFRSGVYIGDSLGLSGFPHFRSKMPEWEDWILHVVVELFFPLHLTDFAYAT